MQSLGGTGTLKEFNRAYKQHRLAVTARGEGFMTCAVAELRLRRALIPYFVGGNIQTPSLFVEVFGADRLVNSRGESQIGHLTRHRPPSQNLFSGIFDANFNQ
jgi:hypothetical protein